MFKFSLSFLSIYAYKTPHDTVEKHLKRPEIWGCGILTLSLTLEKPLPLLKSFTSPVNEKASWDAL